MKAEGLTPAQVAVMCGVTEMAVRTWMNRSKRMSGRSLLAFQRGCKTFRELTLGDSPEQEAA